MTLLSLDGFTQPHSKKKFLIFMEKVKQNPGKHVLFGDNLASHFNML